jgi:hypothetical protein
LHIDQEDEDIIYRNRKIQVKHGFARIVRRIYLSFFNPQYNPMPFYVCTCIERDQNISAECAFASFQIPSEQRENPTKRKERKQKKTISLIHKKYIE